MDTEEGGGEKGGGGGGVLVALCHSGCESGGLFAFSMRTWRTGRNHLPGRYDVS